MLINGMVLGRLHQGHLLGSMLVHRWRLLDDLTLKLVVLF